MQEWDGNFWRFGLAEAKHYWGDFGPVLPDIWDAVKVTRDVLRDYGRVDPIEYFPNPCG